MVGVGRAAHFLKDIIAVGLCRALVLLLLLLLLRGADHAVGAAQGGCGASRAADGAYPAASQRITARAVVQLETLVAEYGRVARVYQRAVAHAAL